METVILQTPVANARAPAPDYPELARDGRVISIFQSYVPLQTSYGFPAMLAFSRANTWRALAPDIGQAADAILFTGRVPAGAPFEAWIGPYLVRGRTAPLPPALRALGAGDLVLASPELFPSEALAPVLAVTVFTRAPTAPPLAQMVRALETYSSHQASDPSGAAGTSVRSSLPLARELGRLQTHLRRWAAGLGFILAAVVALVFGACGLLELTATAYQAALLRSFGAPALALLLQRAGEAAILANAAGAAALTTIRLVASPLGLATAVSAPVIWVALNAGVLVSLFPVAWALRRPVGVILS